MKTLDLEWLLKPLDVSEFSLRSLNIKPIYLSRPDASYQDLMTLSDIDAIVTTMNHQPFSMVKDGFIIPPKSFRDGLDKDRILDYYNQGASIILDSLERSWDPLLKLCISCQNRWRFAKNVTANVYLTPPSSQAFKVHSDWQDVFILQIAGAKSWKVFEPYMRSPINESHIKLPDGYPNESDIRLDLKLQPGDLLYIPRGFPHEVKTINSFSLHITLTIVPYTWKDVYTKLIEITTSGHEEMRESISHDFFHDPINHVLSRNKQVVSLLENPNVLQLVAQALESEKLKNSLSNFRGHFTTVTRKDQIGNETLFYANKYVPCLVKSSNGETIISTNKGDFKVEGATKEISFIFSKDSFSLSQLPGKLSLEDRVELVSSLIDEGLVRF